MKCPICKNEKIVLLEENCEGYGNKFFKIFECNLCNTQFIGSSKLNQKIYDEIYSSENVEEYQRYLKYAEKIKKEKNPLKFLSDSEPSYFPLYNFLRKNKKNLEILEIGCGLGYTSYSLTKIGHKVIGIDISKKAIEKAKKTFPEVQFISNSLEEYSPHKKFDLIVATELIEHLNDIPFFIKKCLSLLKKEGKIILSTPNRDYGKKIIWGTDIPPIHTVWLSKKSFLELGKNLNFQTEFINFHRYFGNDLEKAYSFFIKKIHKRKNISKKNIVGRKKRKLKNLLLKIIFFKPIRITIKFVSDLIKKEDHILGVIISK